MMSCIKLLKLSKSLLNLIFKNTKENETILFVQLLLQMHTVSWVDCKALLLTFNVNTAEPVCTT